MSMPQRKQMIVIQRPEVCVCVCVKKGGCVMRQYNIHPANSQLQRYTHEEEEEEKK